MSQELNKFLKDMTLNSKYEFLELASNKNELEEVAEKARIVLPNNDLAIFKCLYAYVDRQNLNGCTLTLPEVEKGMGTLVGKAIDFDHLRQKVVGHWIDIKIENDTIIAYGAFFKGNFKEDYELIKSMFEEGTVAISFEAYGFKDNNSDSYSLLDIEFSGGALLIKTDPAFPGARVEEMANKTRVLELASVMTEPNKYIHTATEKKAIEKAKLDTYDTDNMVRLVNDSKCPVCKNTYWYDIKTINYSTSKVTARCFGCGSDLVFDLKPTITITKKGVNANLDKIIDEGGNVKMDEKIKELEGKLNDLVIKSTAKDAEIAKLQEESKAKDVKITELSASKTEEEAKTVEELTTEIAKSKEEAIAKDEKINELAEKIKAFEVEAEAKKKEAEEAKLAERKTKLGEEFAKDMTDEQILNDSDYQIATLKKQVSLLKEGKPIVEDAQVLETGSQITKSGDRITKLAEGVKEKAWGPEKE